MIQCVWRQSLRFGNRIHRLKPTECCNTVCCPTKTNRQQSFSVVQLQECKHAMSSSPGNGSPFTTTTATSAVGEYMQGHVAPALGNASQVHCWTNSLLFPGMTNGRGGLSLLSWGKPEEENIDIWGSLDSGWLSDLPTSNHSQVSTTGGTKMSQKAESSGIPQPITSFTL